MLTEHSGFGAGYDTAPPPLKRAGAVAGRQAKAVVQRVLRAALGTVGYLADDRLRQRSVQGEDGVTPSARVARPPVGAIGRILVIRTDLLGDLVLTLPAIAALRRGYPAATIDLLVQPGTAGILEGQPGIDRVWRCDPDGWLGTIHQPGTRQQLRDLVALLRQARYDLVVSVCGDWASIFARLSGAPWRVGYAGEAYAHFLNDPLPSGRYQLHQHETAYVLALAAHAGGIIDLPDSPARLPHLAIVPAASATIHDLLNREGIRAGQPMIALHAGSRNGQAKRWPLPYWARLAELLAQAGDPAIVLVGAPGDKPLAQEVIRHIQPPARAIDLTGKTNLPELAALLAACAVVVTGDSGPLHIAEAVGTRVVALHGPTDPVQSGPCHSESIVLRRDLWCSPCYDARATAECRFHNPICMKQILPSAVLPAVLAQLQAASQS